MIMSAFWTGLLIGLFGGIVGWTFLCLWVLWRYLKKEEANQKDLVNL